MVNVKNLQMSLTHFCASCYRFKDIKLQIFDLQIVGQGHGLQIFATTPFDGKCQNLKMYSKQFCASFYRFKVDIKNNDI